jgi:hypothetical protein
MSGGSHSDDEDTLTIEEAPAVRARLPQASRHVSICMPTCRATTWKYIAIGLTAASVASVFAAVGLGISADVLHKQGGGNFTEGPDGPTAVTPWVNVSPAHITSMYVIAFGAPFVLSCCAGIAWLLKERSA